MLQQVLLVCGMWGAPDNVLSSPPRTLVVVAASQYREALTPWLAHRAAQGFEVRLIDPESILGAQQGPAAVTRLREEIERHVAERDPVERGAVPTFVLLVGDAPAPDERLETSQLLPPGIQLEKARPRRQKLFATDNVYALPDERGRAYLAVGRWPVRSANDVAVQVQKSLYHERGQTAGLHRRDVTFIATTPNYDPALDPILERMAMAMMNGKVMPHWGLRAIYSSPLSDYFPGPESTQRQVIQWLEDATPFTLFAGHGFDGGVDVVRYENRDYAVLDTRVATNVRGTRPGTTLWMSTCSCGDFDLPRQRRGLAESLMMNPHGPVAVIAGSDETSAYVNLLHCLGLAELLEQPAATLGEAFIQFKRAAFRPGSPVLKSMLLAMEPAEHPDLLADDHQYLYNLLGDPTLPLSLPRRLAISVEVNERESIEPGKKLYAVSGQLDDWESGSARLSLLLDRLQMKEAVPHPASLPGAEARQAAYFDRFKKANDKIAAQADVRVSGGRFTAEFEVSEALAARVRWLQVYVCTEPGANGLWQDGVAAHAVKLVADEPQK